MFLMGKKDSSGIHKTKKTTAVSSGQSGRSGTPPCQTKSGHLKAKMSRKSYTREQKLEIIRYAKEHNDFQASKKYDVDGKNIRRWKDVLKDIIDTPKGTRTKRGKAPVLPILEHKLYKKFQKRKKGGQKSTEKWFLRAAKKLHEKSASQEACSFTRGWFRGFKYRYNLSKRAATQKGSKSIDDKEPLIRDFHQRVRKAITEIGPLEPSQIANCDQTPMPFAFWGGKTFADKGDKQVWIKTLKSGDEKRFCTVHLTVFADGKPRVKPLIIFRGTGKRIKNVEKSQYHPKVKVEFQKDAWCDETQFTIYINSQLARMKKPGPLLLVLDSHRAQKTENVFRVMHSKNIKPVVVSPGCTGQIQVLDVAFNKEFKSLVAESFDQYMDDHFEKLENENISASERRVLVTKWVGTAWNRMHADGGVNETVIKAFEFTGVTLPIDGSMDDKIKIYGLEGYRVGKALWETLDKHKTFSVIQPGDDEYEDSVLDPMDDLEGDRSEEDNDTDYDSMEEHNDSSEYDEGTRNSENSDIQSDSDPDIPGPSR